MCEYWTSAPKNLHVATRTARSTESPMATISLFHSSEIGALDPVAGKARAIHGLGLAG